MSGLRTQCQGSALLLLSLASVFVAATTDTTSTSNSRLSRREKPNGNGPWTYAVGGAIGGALVLCVIALSTFFHFRKRKAEKEELAKDQLELDDYGMADYTTSSNKRGRKGKKARAEAAAAAQRDEEAAWPQRDESMRPSNFADRPLQAARSSDEGGVKSYGGKGATVEDVEDEEQQGGGKDGARSNPVV